MALAAFALLLLLNVLLATIVSASAEDDGLATSRPFDLVSRYVFALTLDSRLHAIDPQSCAGKQLCGPKWSTRLLNGPLLVSSANRDLLALDTAQGAKPSALLPMDPVFLVEPLGNGTVYAYLPGEALQKLPLTVRQLVEQSPGRLSDGTLYLGSRQSSLLELDFDGRRLEPNSASPHPSILMGKTLLSLNVVRHDGSQKWNTTLTMLEGVRGASVSNMASAWGFFSAFKFFPTFNGQLIARSRKTNRLKWTCQFEFPVVALFHVVPLESSAQKGLRHLHTLKAMSLGRHFIPRLSPRQDSDMISIGEIDATLFVLPQSQYPINLPSSAEENRPDGLPEDIAVGSDPGYEDDDQAALILRPPQLVDDFDPTECFPGGPNFPECLKGAHFAYQPFPVPLLEGAVSRSWWRQLLVILPSIVLGALVTWLLTRSYRRRPPANVVLMTQGDKLKVFEDQILGYGSHGTVVFKGEFDGRVVAVKRLLLEFYEIAGQEAALLQHSDTHPNVIRYFCRERTEKFILIALEWCPRTLQDVIDESLEACGIVTRKAYVRQIVLGLQHLHSLGIVHRDIKPGNILITPDGRVVLSDFGVSKKLIAGQLSFQPTVATGTSGWRAPEVILSDEANRAADCGSSYDGLKSAFPVAASDSGSISKIGIKVTRAIDIFAAGCVFYALCTGGKHPFGGQLERDTNIISGRKPDLSALDEADSEKVLLKDLIMRMLDRKPERRPTADTILKHPLFWEAHRRLQFLEAASDRLERDERTLGITNRAMEAHKADVLGPGNVSWHSVVDRSIWESTEYRRYFGNSLQDLLRLIRNKRHHWQELPTEAKRLLGDPTTGYLQYFLRAFPKLLLVVWLVVGSSPYLLEAPFSTEFF
jgi:serine/threonine protein kinase